MIQYCRYCSHAVDYSCDGFSFICTAPSPCGLNGAGKQYSATKAKRPNSCPHFEFCENDVFGMDENGNFRTYKPRTKKAPPEYQQIEMELPK